MNDLKFACRQLLKNPGFTAVAVLTLALGIGANTAIFQLFNAVRLKALPVAKPQELIEVRFVGGNTGIGISDGSNSEMTYPLWEQFQKHRGNFSGIFAWGSSDLPIGTEAEVRMAHSVWVSGDFFSVLGIAPTRGRLLNGEDDRRGTGPGGVVISHAFWQREFGGDDSVVGKSMTIGDRVFEIIGVTPPRFFGLEVGKSFDVALPLTARALWQDNILDRTDAWWLRIMARLKPGSALSQAAEFVTVASPAMIEATVFTGYDPRANERYRALRLSAFPAGAGVSQLRSHYNRSLWLLLGITGLVLVIACVNLANLTLVRAGARTREFAVRLAIGASRRRLIVQLLSESLLLAAAGACAGAWFGRLLSQSVVWFLSTQGNRLDLDLSTDWRVLAFTSAVAVLTCVCFGLAPAIRATSVAPAVALSSGGRGIAGARERFALQRGLAISQMAVSLVLLAGALLLVRSFWNLVTLNPGFRQDGVFAAYVDFTRLKLTPEQSDVFKSDLLEKIRAIPRVEAAAITSHIPIISGSWTMGVRVTGAGETEGWSKVAWVSPQYFRTLEIPILAGRDVSSTDTATSPKIALVNEVFVRQWLGGANPIGAHARTIAEPGYPEATYEIVGVVRDTKYGALRDEVPPMLFAPALQHPKPGPWLSLVIRSSAPLPGVIAAVNQRIAEADRSTHIKTTVLKTQIREGLARERLMAWLSGFFGALASLLVMVGLYGLVSHTTLTRRNEFGIRMALGAQRSDILRLVLRQGFQIAAIGIAIGVAGALALTRFLSGLLFGLDANDPTTLVIISAFVAAVALFACWLPARRATRIHPMEALRYE